MSADVPGLPPGAIARAFELLGAGAGVVLGPALDGGYWLIAMSAYHAEAFRAIPWSTPAVLGVTVARCAGARLRVELREPWRDVETLVDLDFLFEAARALDALRTVGVLHELARAGLIGSGPPGVRLVEGELLAGTPWRAVVRDRLAGRDGRETSYTSSPARVRRSSFRSPTAATSCSSASTATRCETGRSRCPPAPSTTARRRSTRRGASSPRRPAEQRASGRTCPRSTAGAHGRLIGADRLPRHDAIHLVTAIRIASAGPLDAVITYDARLAAGMLEHRLAVLAPG